MLRDNLKNLRKAKGFSQEELAVKLNVVRQTVSKWEQGLSVPDSEMLLRIAAELDTTVNVLLGDTVDAEESSDLKTIAAKLEVLNEQFAKRNETRRKVWRAIFIVIGVLALFALIQMLIKVIWLQIVINSVSNNGSASTAIIGGADGPTSILVATVINLLYVSRIQSFSAAAPSSVDWKMSNSLCETMVSPKRLLFSTLKSQSQTPPFFF